MKFYIIKAEIFQSLHTSIRRSFIMAFKRLIICCDGTWQKINVTYPTNVVKIKSAVEAVNHRDQVVFYDPGVGTSNWFLKILGGMFGWGLFKNVKECYEFLCRNWEHGDEIYLFGFSRGAFTVRSVAGLLYKCGIVKNYNKMIIRKVFRLYKNRYIHPDHSSAVNFRKKYSHQNGENSDRPVINFLGCWDTVGALGIPDLSSRFNIDKLINRKFEFHDTKLSDIIQHVRHAVAIDEHRKVFDFTPMKLSDSALSRGTDLNQIWFIGDHGCIGGGEKEKEPFSDITLNWMMRELQKLDSKLGIVFDPSKIPTVEVSNYMAPFQNDIKGIYKIAGEIDRAIPNEFNKLHWTVKERLKEDNSYNPPHLRTTFQSFLKRVRSEKEETLV
jgi:uncharacterized protein (DUF2235 family)